MWSKIQNLPFAQACAIYRKTVANTWNWYERWVWRSGTGTSVWNTVYSDRENRITFSDLLLLPEISTGTTRKVVTCITGILRKLYGKMVKHLKDAGKRTVGSVCLGGMGFWLFKECYVLLFRISNQPTGRQWDLSHLPLTHLLAGE